MSEVIAYTIGSMWYCPDCVAALGPDDELEPVTAQDAADGLWTYVCDSCREVI